MLSKRQKLQISQKLKTEIYANNMASRRSRMRPPNLTSNILTNNGCIEAILIYK